MSELIYVMRRDSPCTAEQFLRHDCGMSRRLLSHLKATGGITVNGRILRSIDTVHPGDTICLHMDDAPNIPPNPALHTELVYADEELFLFNKPAGMPVHPSLHHADDTLGNAFAAQFPGMTFRPVHRLDQDTSGLVAVAANPLSASTLPGRLHKTYLALVTGMPPDEGIISVPIGRMPGSIIARRTDPDGKPALTRFRTLARGKYSLVAVQLGTGRTHQIRVHMAHIGCPLAGDGLYGGCQEDLSRHALHCAVMLYTDRHDVQHTISAPLPEDMRRLTSWAGTTDKIAFA
ncbi:MAG: RluA family pseudouridine synthase [Oscillospiraceae bacterium]|nr:RluA family pseudouridine synthase [Oscillospiraceae bacterium]